MKLDKNQNGTIDKDEFLSIPGISANPLATRVIDIFDEDGGGDVDFKEFLVGLSVFSSKGLKEEKLKCTTLKIYTICTHINDETYPYLMSCNCSYL